MVLSGANIASSAHQVTGPSSRRVFVFDPQAAYGGGVVSALTAQGYACAHVATSLDGLPDRVADAAPDILVLVEGSHGSQVLNVVEAIRERHDCPIVLFSEDGTPKRMRQAVAVGVSSYVVIGVGENRVRSAIDMAFVQFDEMATLRRERDHAMLALSERKLVERAKSILMTQRAMNEGDAFRFLQKTSMDRNVRLAEVAEQIIDAAELLGTGAPAVPVEGEQVEISSDPLMAVGSEPEPDPDGQRRSGGSDG